MQDWTRFCGALRVNLSLNFTLDLNHSHLRLMIMTIFFCGRSSILFVAVSFTSILCPIILSSVFHTERKFNFSLFSLCLYCRNTFLKIEEPQETKVSMCGLFKRILTQFHLTPALKKIHKYMLFKKSNLIFFFLNKIGDKTFELRVCTVCAWLRANQLKTLTFLYFLKKQLYKFHNGTKSFCCNFPYKTINYLNSQFQ